MVSSPRVQAFMAFNNPAYACHWVRYRLRSEGVETDALDVVSSETGYGLRTKRPIAVDDVVCRVNASVVMNEQHAARSVVAPIIRQMYNDHGRRDRVHTTVVWWGVVSCRCGVVWCGVLTSQRRACRTSRSCCSWCTRRATIRRRSGSHTSTCCHSSFLVLYATCSMCVTRRLTIVRAVCTVCGRVLASA
jgi:hypothetical protein